AITGLQPFPRDIMSWAGQLYEKVFGGFGEFHLHYVFSHRKGWSCPSLERGRNEHGWAV
ncbi:hypothetical protein ABZP36_027675, partial [Zizania latifolia]